MPLDAARIGYVRKAAPPGEPLREAPSGSALSMLRRMERAGFVERAVPDESGRDRYVRTAAGHAEVEAFDAALGESHVELLRRVATGGYRIPNPAPRGYMRMMDGGLSQFLHEDGFPSLTEAGAAFLEARGHEAAPAEPDETPAPRP